VRGINKAVANSAFVAGIVAVFLGAPPAKAATYDVTFTGSSFDVFAVITTANTLDSLGGYDITGISGTVTGPTGGAITNLIFNPSQPYQGTYYDPKTGLGWYYDNVLFAGSTIPFDNNGPLFDFGNGIVGNIYSAGSTFYFSVTNPSSLYNPGDVGTVAVSETPLPAALPLFASGLGALGLLGWRSRRRAAAGIAAI